MSPNQKISIVETQAKLSTLWVFVLLNVLFRDIHELFRSGFLEEVMTGTVKGVQVTEGLLLGAGIMLELQIVMVLLSRISPYRVNRWANLIIAPLTIASIIIAGPSDLDDMFFAVIEVAALFLIVWVAWRWRRPVHPQQQSLSPSTDFA